MRTLLTTRAIKNCTKALCAHCLFLLVTVPLNSFSQAGTITDPFTSIGQAVVLTSPRVYYFNVGGQAFSTYVNSSGELLVAMSYGDVHSALPTTTAMTNDASKILSPAVLSKLDGISLVRVTSNGPRNVNFTSENAGIFARLTNNQALNYGNGTAADATLNSSWTGQGAHDAMDAWCASTTTPNDLAKSLFHPCGNSQSFVWAPELGVIVENFSDGALTSSQYLQLWVKGTYTPTSGGGSGGYWSLSGIDIHNTNTGIVSVAGTPTNLPGGENIKFTVNGTIYAKKITITQSAGWPDYVFDSNYRLRSLQEVEKFITKNKHLPGVPSTAQVDKQGISVGENQEILLKKIEELTLYVIGLNKNMYRLKKQLAVQRIKLQKAGIK